MSRATARRSDDTLFYDNEPDLAVDAFIDVLRRSTLAERRKLELRVVPLPEGTDPADLLQRSLTESKRNADVARRRVVEHGRFVADVPSHANRAEEEVFDAPAEAERELGLRRNVLRLKKRRAKPGEHKRLDPCAAAESIDDVALQLSGGHRKQVCGACCRADPQRRRLPRPEHFGAPLRTEETRHLYAPREPAADVQLIQLGCAAVDRRRGCGADQAGGLPRLRPNECRRTNNQDRGRDEDGEAAHGVAPRITM